MHACCAFVHVARHYVMGSNALEALIFLGFPTMTKRQLFHRCADSIIMLILSIHQFTRHAVKWVKRMSPGHALSVFTA